MELALERPYPPETLGRPSKKAAAVALKAHLAVTKGDPIRLALSSALKKEQGLGGHERRFAAFATRELSRHQRLLDLAAKEAGHAPGRWALAEDRVLVRYVLWRRLFTHATWKQLGPEVKLPGPLRPRSVQDGLLESVAQTPLPALPDPEDPTEAAAVRHSFPQWLAQRIAAQVGPEVVDRALGALNEEPRVFLRVRPPMPVDEAVRALADEGVAAEEVPWAPRAVRVLDKGMRVFDTALMKRGRLQVQEPGSQLIAALCHLEAEAGSARPLSVADLCAGAGGKTMALADALGEGGVVWASDASRKRLEEGRRRVREAKLTNVRFSENPPLAEVDVALIDAPCSGVGSLGREPEQKWKLTAARVEELVRIQRQLLEQTLQKLRPGARIVYATCSLLTEENEEVVAGVLRDHPELEVEPAESILPASSASVWSGPYVRVWPHLVGTGGFFAARLVRRR